MEHNNDNAPLECHCNMTGLKPIMMDLPYPPIQVKEPNRNYVNLLSVDYCGSVSELSAITQYINNENRLICQKCSIARTLLGIAMAEMMHLNMLGELMHLLGGPIDYIARQPGKRPAMWSPSYLTLSEQAPQMLRDNIESEKAAINQYRMHMNVIKDENINAVLARIIKDEEYHIMILQALLKEY